MPPDAPPWIKTNQLMAIAEKGWSLGLDTNEQSMAIWGKPPHMLSDAERLDFMERLGDLNGE